MYFRKPYAFIIAIAMLPLHNSSLFAESNENHQSAEYTRGDVNPDLEIIRKRVIRDLLEKPVDQDEVKRLLKSIRDDGSWPDIDYVDVSRTAFDHARHLERLFELSRAYKKSDSPWFQHPLARNAAMSALDYWLEHDFICDNWWWNEMGTPARMINTLLVMDTDLNESQIREGLRISGRANLEASGARPGGDLIQIAAMLGKQALFRRDDTVLERVVMVMTDEIKVTTGRGLKPDMSFHHRVDNVICTLSYGLGYANSFSWWAVRTAGTRYGFPEHTCRLLIDYFLDGICKSMVHGWYPDPGAKNRDLSRMGTLHAAGTELAENLLKISEYRKAELEEIASIRRGEIRPSLSWNRMFWHSEYATHQRPGYFASVRMHSSRNHTMEQPHNEEGLKMHHVGDGSNFVSLTGKEYFNIFPVWDWQRIPGTTVVQKPVHPHWKYIAKKGLTDFVGGASNGQYGLVAMDFKSAHDPLSARKAWFFFDDEYVCLGSEITSTAEHPVFTTLNQCLLNGDAVVKTKKDERVLTRGSHSLSQVSWIWHDQVAYLFPDAVDAHVSNDEARGTWRSINHQSSSSADTVRMDVFTAWLDHGTRPAKEKYAYIVAPAATPGDLARYQKSSPIQILGNSDSFQGVLHRGLNRVQIAFYQPDQVKATDHLTVRAMNPCLVMVKMNGRSIQELVVSDPTHKLSKVELRVSTLIEGSGEQWKAVWDKKEKESVIDIELPGDGYAGQSVVLTLPLPQ